MIRLITSLLLLPIVAAQADVIRLKSGETLEGKVTRTTSDEVTIEVQFSPTITDERVIARTAIEALGIISEDEEAFQKIRDADTPPTVLSPKACDAVIKDVLQPFLEQYPSSDRADTVRLRIRSIRADIERLKSGDVKVSGIWYDKSSFSVEKYQIEAATALDAMMRHAGEGNVVPALNSFALLQTSYPNSMACIEAVPLALKTLSKLLLQLNIAINELPEIKLQRQAAIDRTPPEQRQAVKQAIAAEDARADAAAKLAAANKQPFFPILPYDEKGLKAMQSTATALEKKLTAIDPGSLAEDTRLARQAHKELDEREYTGAEVTLAELAKAWPAYEALPRLKKRLDDALAANKASAEAAAKKSPAPKSP